MPGMAGLAKLGNGGAPATAGRGSWGAAAVLAVEVCLPPGGSGV